MGEENCCTTKKLYEKKLREKDNEEKAQKLKIYGKNQGTVVWLCDFFEKRSLLNRIASIQGIKSKRQTLIYTKKQYESAK